jgi:hypothetical protein
MDAGGWFALRIRVASVSQKSDEISDGGCRINGGNRRTDRRGRDPQISGDDFEEATPDPIPNSEVKLFGADGTAREAVWESRTLPGLFLKA